MTEQKLFMASEEAKGQARQLRLFAILAWVMAMAGQVFAILKLIHNETLTWLIVAIVAILILAILGSWLWKKPTALIRRLKRIRPDFLFRINLVRSWVSWHFCQW